MKISGHLAVVAGVAILLWSSVEDSDARAVAGLGALTALSLSLALMKPHQAGRWRPGQLPALCLLLGALTGALAGLTTPLLMLFKNLRHAHIFPDYPLPMTLAILERLPPWALAGALAGFGIGILLKLRAEWPEKRG